MKGKKINIFSEKSLVILVSVTTLFLQLISFFTTWNGSKIYFEGIFPFAPLCFAIAIQSTAYFFSNSLRNRISVLKICALVVAICCSTYFSYIGIYNSVNSPRTYLQEKYAQISTELKNVYEQKLKYCKIEAKNAINDANLAITEEYSKLMKEISMVEKCNAAMQEEKESNVATMKAPKVTDYEKYEDYATAYSAYVAGSKEGSNIATTADRDMILNGFGFSSVTELNELESDVFAKQNTITSALGVNSIEKENVLAVAGKYHSDLLVLIDNSAVGKPPQESDLLILNRFINAAKICGNTSVNEADILHVLNSLSRVAGQKLLLDYTELEAESADEMELKAGMDGQIMSAIIKIDSMPYSEVLPGENEENYEIMDLYLIPIYALSDSKTRMMAFFCLGMAGLIDLLSVLFAISLKGRKPLWEKKVIFASWVDEYASQIYAMLNKEVPKEQALQEFLAAFSPSPESETEGYMMQANFDTISDWRNLLALLCQINMAKIMPAGMLENDNPTVLLKARFVFWANNEIAKTKEVRGGISYE